MNGRIVITGMLALLATSTAPAFAETAKDTTRIEKLEERTRDLEARVAKVEAAAHKQMGMMQHDHGMPNDATANGPMGQMPQQGSGAMPQGGAQQQPQGGAMPPAGGAMPPMGHM